MERVALSMGCVQVLVLQVGRFQYHKNALQKICAPVEHPMQLRLERDMLSQDARRQHNLYNLTAKVVHHGALLRADRVASCTAWGGVRVQTRNPCGAAVHPPCGLVVFDVV